MSGLGAPAAQVPNSPEAKQQATTEEKEPDAEEKPVGAPLATDEASSNGESVFNSAPPAEAPDFGVSAAKAARCWDFTTRSAASHARSAARTTASLDARNAEEAKVSEAEEVAKSTIQEEASTTPLSPKRS